MPGRRTGVHERRRKSLGSVLAGQRKWNIEPLNGCKAEKDHHSVYPTNLNTPKVELYQRVSNLQIYLQKNNIEGALILQRVDLFYFTGTIQQAHLYVPAHGDPLLVVRKSYDRACAESSIEKIMHLDRTSDIPNILKASGHALPATLGLELDVLPTNLFFNYQGIFGKSFRRLQVFHHVSQFSIIGRNCAL